MNTLFKSELAWSRRALRKAIIGAGWLLNYRAIAAIEKQQQRLNNSRAGKLLACSGNNALVPEGYWKALSSGRPSYKMRLQKAMKENALLLEDSEFLELIHEPVPGTGICLLAAALWLERPTAHWRRLLPWRAAAMEKQCRREAIPLDAVKGDQQILTVQEEESLPFENRKFGLNIIGHAFNVFGIGEDARAITAAVEAAGIPCCVIDHPAANGSRTNDRTLERLTLPAGKTGPYAFNLVCMAAPIHARWICQEGVAQWKDRYTIASWPWELERWPQSWEPSLWLADEVWPYSSLIAKALQTFEKSHDVCTMLRVVRMPPSAEIKNPQRYAGPEARQQNRALFGLPEHSILFIFGFDMNSTISRKNPFAVLEAFERAFPKTSSTSPRVGLVIKTLPTTSPHPAWQRLKHIAEIDSRIYLIRESLDRDKLLGLYGCCDCFVSLHRSEGLGRGHAEALQMGLDVVVTDYGSTVDFCQGPLAHPVRYQLIPVKANEYYDHTEQYWADADIDDAAARMKEVAMARMAQTASRQELGQLYISQFSHANAGACYRRRLTELWDNRKELTQTLKYKRFQARKSMSLD